MRAIKIYTTRDIVYALSRQPSTHQKIIFVILFAFTTPVLAQYIGPNREATTYSEVCKVVLRECMWVEVKGDYRYHKVDEWSCASEGKEWLAYPEFPSVQGCIEGTVGNQYWEKEYSPVSTTITHPEATITGQLQNCTLQNGWCVTAPQLELTANEPLSNEHIEIIEISHNNATVSCQPLQISCSFPLFIEGENTFEYWATSSWGDSSRKGNMDVKVDTVAPNINLQIDGAFSPSGWYLSEITLTAIGQDSTSGILESLLSVDDGTYIPTTTLSDGVYHIDVMAKDNALNTTSASTTLQVDTVTPTLSLTVDGTKSNNNFYTSNTKITANTTDATSGVALVQAKIDNGNWIDASEINLSDGLHTYQFRVYDNAGNFTESPIRQISIDTIPPTVEADTEINLGDTIHYTLQDSGSGLAISRIVIEDEDEKYKKIVWLQNITGDKVEDEILWDGKFSDKTVAGVGEYYITFKISDRAGNETFFTTVVNVNPLSYFQVIPEFIPPVNDDIETSDEITSNESQSDEESNQQNFGGTTSITNNNEITTQTLSLGSSATAGTNATTNTTSNILWGAAAAAAIGMATAYALEQQRQRDEEEAQQLAQVQASVDAQNAAVEANRIAMMEQLRINNWLEGQAILAAQQQQAADEEFEEQWNDDRREHSLDTMSEVVANQAAERVQEGIHNHLMSEHQDGASAPSQQTLWTQIQNINLIDDVISLANSSIDAIRNASDVLTSSITLTNSTRWLLNPMLDLNQTWSQIQVTQLLREIDYGLITDPYQVANAFEGIANTPHSPINYTTLSQFAESASIVIPGLAGITSSIMSIGGYLTGNENIQNTGDVSSGFLNVLQGVQTWGDEAFITRTTTTTTLGRILTPVTGILGAIQFFNDINRLENDSNLNPIGENGAWNNTTWIERVGVGTTAIGGGFLAIGAVAAFVVPPAAAVLIPAGLIFTGAGTVMQNWGWITEQTNQMFGNSTPSSSQPIQPAPPVTPIPVSTPAIAPTPSPTQISPEATAIPNPPQQPSGTPQP